MFQSRIFMYFAAALVAAFLAASIYRAGYNAAEVSWQRAHLAAANAYAELAREYTAADAQLAKYRSEARSMAADNRRLRDERLEAVPDRGLELAPDERDILRDSYCAKFPTAPSCGLLGTVSGVSDATSDGVESEGVGSLGGRRE